MEYVARNQFCRRHLTAAIAICISCVVVLPASLFGQSVAGLLEPNRVVTAPPPSCITGDASSITEISGKLNGSVDPNNRNTTVWFEWGIDSAFLVFTTTATQSIGWGSSYVSVNTTLTGLLPGTRYYYRVSGLNSRGLRHGSIESFVTIPLAPVPVSPADAEVDVYTAPTLLWSPSLGATSYHLQVSTNSVFRDFAVNTSGITGTSYVARELGSSSVYYWRVGATNESGTSAFSPVQTFTTIDSQPDMPVCLSPQNLSTNVPTNTVLSWDPSARAKSYRVQVSKTPLFISPMIDSRDITETSKSLTGLEHQTVYYWRVGAVNGSGQSPFSEAWSFVTSISLLPSPSLMSPEDGATGIAVNPLLNWVEVEGAHSYCVQVALEETFFSKVVDSTVTDGSTLTVNGLVASTPYFWRVAAIDTSGRGLFSAPRKFITGGITSVELQETDELLTFQLSQNYPNPFNPSTRFEFRVPETGRVVLRILDQVGRELQVLVDEQIHAGAVRQVTFDATEFPSGVYFAQLQFGTQQKTRKLVLLK